MTTLLSIRELSKSFSGVTVVDQVSVEIEEGEVLGILGENGAGKSTLLKMICGIYSPKSGTILLRGEEVNVHSPTVAKDLGICMIPQEFNLINTLNVYENVFLGRELKSGFLLQRKVMIERTQELLKELHSDISPKAPVSSLSVAQKQMVEIAKALVFDAKILVMDEPSTVLTDREVETLYEIINKLRAKGVTILFISHKLKEVKQICDRLLILRDGKVVSLDQVSEIDEKSMAEKMVGRELNQVFPQKREAQAAIAMEVENLSVQGQLDGITFQLKKGEVLGLAGLMGAGRTECAEAIMGLREKTSGRIKLNGQELTINSVADALKNRIAYLSEDRQGTGLIMNFESRANISLSSMQLKSAFFLEDKKEKETTEKYWREFNINASSPREELRRYSGGNQQKVYLAKCMDVDPQVLILDEPTRGIDVNAKSEIYLFIQSLIERGLSVIVISSELEEIIGLCHRTLVMREGRICGELKGEHLTEEEIMYLATGAKEAS